MEEEARAIFETMAANRKMLENSVQRMLHSLHSEPAREMTLRHLLQVKPYKELAESLKEQEEALFASPFVQTESYKMRIFHMETEVTVHRMEADVDTMPELVTRITMINDTLLRMQTMLHCLYFRVKEWNRE